MSVFNLHQGVVAGTAANQGTVFDTNLIGKSVWLDGSSDYLNKTFASAPGSQSGKRYVWACWVQPPGIHSGTVFPMWSAGTSASNAYTEISFYNQQTHGGDLEFYSYNGGSSYDFRVRPTQIFRDNRWQHFLVSFDSTQASSAYRIQIYHNGNLITSYASASYPSQDFVDFPGTATGHYIGSRIDSTKYKDYMAQHVFLDSKSIQNGDVSISDFLDTFTFGTHGSQVIPKKNSDIAALASTAGGNSFCLDFEDTSNFGNDISTNTNDFTANSMAAANQSNHTPSLSYPVLDALDPTTATATNGGLDFAGPSADDKAAMRTTIGIPDDSGKWYWEYKMTGGSNDALMFGIAGPGETSGGYDDWVQDITPQIALYTESGSNRLYEDGSQTSTTVFSTGAPVSGTTIGVAYDSATRKIWFASNNVYANTGNPAAGSGETGTLSGSGTAFPTVSARGSSDTLTLRFDSGDFVYSAPSGFKELNTKNLTAPTYQGIDYFDATLYEGNGDNQRVGDFVPFTDTFAIGSSAMWYSEDIRRLSHTYSSEATATSDDSSNAAVYRKATISFWVKFIETNDSDQQVFLSQSNSGQTERFIWYAHGTDDYVYIIIDPSGSDNNRQFRFSKGLLSTQNWSHVLLHLDTNNSTAADRMKLWINGNSVTNTETSRPYTAMTQGQDLFLFRNEELMIGHLSPSDTYASVYNFNSYLAEYHVIDGYNKAISDFGEVDTSTNRWVAKDYKTNVGTYGNRGFYLKFDGTPGASSGSNMGKDSSGNNIHLTEETHGSGSAWATTDKFIDSPSKNFATFDRGYSGGGSNTISEGGTRVKGTDGSNSDSAVTTFGMTGKVVFDFKFHTVGGGYPKVGFITGQEGLDDINKSSGSIEIGTTNTAGSVAFGSSGSFYRPTGADSTTYFSTISTGQSVDADDVIRYEVDTNAGTVRVYFQNEGTGSFTEITSARIDNFDFDPNFPIRPAVSNYNNSEVSLLTGGQTSLSSVSTDFLELNQDNLDATASKLTAWSWIRGRDSNDTYNHILHDRVRGVGKSLDLFSNSTVAEVTEENTVMRFLQRGVQVGSDTQVNAVNESYVMWQWLVGDSAGTGSTNSSGSVDSTVITADAGHFSVGTFTGAGGSSTIGHGLSAAPEFFLVKRVGSSGTGWFAYSKDTTDPNNKYLRLQTTGAEASASGAWTPGATTMGLNESVLNGINTSSVKHLFIAFRSVPGVCKVGKFVGNGNHDGPYVSMGFKPAWYMQKDITTTSAWYIYDFRRPGFNSATVQHFLANTFAQEAIGANNEVDLLADGVKNRGDNADTNASNSTFIYIAMAEIAGNGTLPPIYGR